MVSSPIYLFLLGLFPALFWLLFFLIEDSKKPEPMGMIAEVFTAGALSGVVAVVLEALVLSNLSANRFFGMNTPGEFLIFSFIEETVIFLAAYFTIAKNRFHHQHLDAMVYMVTAGLGFAALENILYLLSSGSAVAIQTILIRSVGATLLHAIASGIVGFYWAERKVVKGLGIATLVHTAFDWLAYFSPSQVYSIAFVLIVSFFIFHDFDILKSEDNG